MAGEVDDREEWADGDPIEAEYLASLGKLSIQQRFEMFRRENPHVEVELLALAHEARKRGYKKAGIEHLYAILRWEAVIQTEDPTSEFRLNDHFTSRYARLLMDQDPALEGFFEIRELRS